MSVFELTNFSFLNTLYDEPAGVRHVRRIPHPGRGVSGTRTRRANMHFSSGGSALSGLSPGTRDTMDPIAELLSQLSSVRSRAAAAQSVSSQLQQLEMQLQSTRYGFGRWLALIYTKSSLLAVRFDLLVLLGFLVNFKIWHGMASYIVHLNEVCPQHYPPSVIRFVLVGFSFNFYFWQGCDRLHTCTVK